jgi:hypothetical protein
MRINLPKFKRKKKMKGIFLYKRSVNEFKLKASPKNLYRIIRKPRKTILFNKRLQKKLISKKNVILRNDKQQK